MAGAKTGPPEWVLAIADDDATTRECWPPGAGSVDFDWDCPTYAVYFDPTLSDFAPPFKEARAKLDYSYHRNPAKSRQGLQDTILATVVGAAEQQKANIERKRKQQDSNHREVLFKRRPWVIFSAGSMGVGKGYVISTLSERSLFPVEEMLHIDPDMIKAELPEMSGYLLKDPINAATKLHRESTQMADVLLEHALNKRLPTLIDGSLKDVKYYKELMTRIRTEFPEYQLAILHVTASPDIIRSRARARAERTGRAIPKALLEESIAQVPKSVDVLSKYVDVAYTISNEDGQPIQLIRKRYGDIDVQNDYDPDKELSWKSFRDIWQCNVGQCQQERKKMLKHLSPWCESKCPGKSRMSMCSKDKKCLDNVKGVFGKAYPSFCPSCTLGDDSQCGKCVHDRHWCTCPECGPAKRKNWLHKPKKIVL